VARQRKRLEGGVAALGPESWKSPRRCDGWSVQDVVLHLVGVNTFWHASVLAGLAGQPTRFLTGFDPATTPAQMVDAMRTLERAEALERLRASNDAFLGTLATLDDDGWSALAETPAGHVPIRLLAHHALWDGWVHERDVLLPLGLTPDVEPDEVLSSLRYAAALSPALAIGSRNVSAGVFTVEATDPDARFSVEVSQSVAVRDGPAPAPPGQVPCLRGDAVALVEALSFRAPLPASAPPEWRRLITGLADAFDVDAARR